MAEIYVHQSVLDEISRRVHELRRESVVAQVIQECILEVLHVREIEVPPDVRTHITSYLDPKVVLPWLHRAVTATEISDLFIDDQA